jgi:enterobactin synthetase component F
LVACWVPRAAEDLTPQALRIFLADRLPFHALPTALVPMQSLPLTTNGKLDLRALPLPGLRPEAEIQVSPTTSEQSMLHGLWTEVLGHADFGITDNFFLAGGDSLAAARLAASLQQTLSQEVSVKWIFRWPTIEEQAAWVLTVRHPGPTPNLVPLQPLGSRPPLFLVHGLGGSVGGFIDLARALAPERPVIGLQASETERMDPMTASVEQIAEGYAEQILRCIRVLRYISWDIPWAVGMPMLSRLPC